MPLDLITERTHLPVASATSISMVLPALLQNANAGKSPAVVQAVDPPPTGFAASAGALTNAKATQTLAVIDAKTVGLFIAVPPCCVAASPCAMERH
jgi:hypothetical protein